MLTFALLVAATPVTTLPPQVIQPSERREVAFEELAANENAAAIAILEEELESQPNDPALMINLGTAYLRAGNRTAAQRMFLAAYDSAESYELELADGRWVNSRRAAELALARFAPSALAMR